MKRIVVTALILAVLLSYLAPRTVQAVAGVPGSPDFGYGAWLHPDGKYFQEGLNSLADLPLDWVAFDLDWADWMPDPGKSPDVSAFDRVMQSAAASDTAVMISLSNPPSWAVTQQGPDAVLTSQTLAFLATRYAGILKAVELFPGANTFEGWKAAPDPAAYARIFSDVKASLASQGIEICLVAAGLNPVSQTSAREWNDLDFLRSLYSAGAAQWLDIVGLRLDHLTGNPLNASQEGAGFGLRHYEAVRQVMLDNNHQSGMIWITRLRVPDGTINSEDKVYQSSQRQAEWLQQTAIQMRSQLYMGVVFFQNINPAPASKAEYGKTALILNPDSFHPFYSVLKAIIQQTRPEGQEQSSGRPKSNSLLKCKYKT